MARTALTPVVVVGPYPTNGTVGVGALAFTFAASDLANGNQYPCTGQEVIVFQNTDAGAQTVTITSAPDSQGRKADITTYSLATGTFAVFLPGVLGWIQSDGNIYINTSNANLKIAVFKLPTKIVT
jgi:hypothetical protein